MQRLLTTRLVEPRQLMAKYEHSIRCAGHLEKGLDPKKRREVVDICVDILSNYEFDAIAFRGLSGALFAPTVAMILDKTLLAVRKNEACHSSRVVEGDYAARQYVILDDMTSSGDTVQTMHTEIKKVMPYARCIGVMQYLWLTKDSDWRYAVKSINHWVKKERIGWTLI